MSDPARITEATALLFSVGAVCGIVFYAVPAESSATPVLLYLPLPFLLWAALRFGLAGSGAAFMIVALTAIWGASHGQGPFAIGTPAQNAFSVQIFLTFTAVMLLTLAAAVQERKHAESRLRDSEDLFATAFRSSPDAISIRRKADGHILEINDRWEETFGYGRDEAVGRTVQELGIYASEAERLRFQAVADDHGSVREIEVGLRARDGRDIRALVAAETVEMGGEPCFITTVRDITAQRAAELEGPRSARRSWKRGSSASN
jgi:two-component system, LuxR family, sensor kinase FixL